MSFVTHWWHHPQAYTIFPNLTSISLQMLLLHTNHTSNFRQHMDKVNTVSEIGTTMEQYVPPLMTLPLEIRGHIYGYVFTSKVHPRTPKHRENPNMTYILPL